MGILAVTGDSRLVASVNEGLIRAYDIRTRKPLVTYNFPGIANKGFWFLRVSEEGDKLVGFHSEQKQFVAWH